MKSLINLLLGILIGLLVGVFLSDLNRENIRHIFTLSLKKIRKNCEQSIVEKVENAKSFIKENIYKKTRTGYDNTYV